jgi:hypothetical protein
MISTLTLTVSSGGVRVPTPDPDDPDTQVWYTADWKPAATFYIAGKEYWADLQGIGAFRVSESGDVLAVPEEGTTFSLLVDAYRRTVLPQALQYFGLEVVHASAVVVPAGVVGFCAYRETGKSTLAFALAQRGYRPWADDALAFETGIFGARALGLPFAIRLRPGSQEYFGVQPLPPEEHPENGTIAIGTESLPLVALCVVSRRTEAEPAGPTVSPLASGEAATSLLPHAYWSSLADEVRKARMLRAYLELANAVRVYRVTIPAGLDDLPTSLDEIERVVLAPPEEA